MTPPQKIKKFHDCSFFLKKTSIPAYPIEILSETDEAKIHLHFPDKNNKIAKRCPKKGQHTH